MVLADAQTDKADALKAVQATAGRAVQAAAIKAVATAAKAKDAEKLATVKAAVADMTPSGPYNKAPYVIGGIVVVIGVVLFATRSKK